MAQGGLSRALLQELGRTAWVSEPKAGLACPRPRSLPRNGWAEEPEAPVRPLTGGSSGSLGAGATNPKASAAGAPCDDPALEAGLAELRRLFASECSLGTSAPGFSVSPPSRSANGLVHDSLWRQEAHARCKASLRVLAERAGPPRMLASASSCAGDYRLLMASPDQHLQLLAGAVEGEAEEPTDRAPAPGSWRASPSSSGGWHPAHCASPEPTDLFTY